MPRSSPKSAAGFTLLETTIALAILALAALGALAAINHSSVELRRGDQRLIQASLADEAIQRQRLAPKASLPTPDNTWKLDPDGAHFTVDAQGKVVPATGDGGIPADTPCASTPRPIMCREIRWEDATPDGGPTAQRLSVRVSYDGVFTEGTTNTGGFQTGLGHSDSYSEVFLKQ